MITTASKVFKIGIALLSISFVFVSCSEDIKLELNNYEYTSDDVSVVEINIEKIKGNNDVATAINNKLTDFVCQSFYLNNSEERATTIKSSVAQFNESYTTFKKQLNDNLFGELPVWEVFVDGELSYQDENLVSFTMSSSINTGALKPITKLAFLNFNKTTGQQLHYNDLVEDKTGFKPIIKSYLQRELMATSYTINQFETKNGVLKNPDHFGYSDSGLIIIYNTPNNGFIECAIPFSKANDYLKY